MKTILAPGVDGLVVEALRISGSKQKYLGVVGHIDPAGTTAFIKSGERTFLAFVRSNNLMPGQQITFRIDGQRAVDCEHVLEPTPPVPEPELKIESLPQVEETEEQQSWTPMQVAFQRLQEK